MNIPWLRFRITGMFSRRVCSAGVRDVYISTCPVAVARPRRSIREGVQAPVARMVRSAVRVVLEVSRTPVTWEDAIRREATWPCTKVMRFVASVTLRR